MKHALLRLAIASIGMTIAAGVFSSLAFSQPVNLYDQPASSAKLIGSADMSTGIIPIMTSSNGEWIKAADPRNGNVGWVKVIDIKNAKGTTNSFTLKQDMLSSGAQPKNYQIIQNGAPKGLTDEQLKTFMNTMQKEQKNIQNSFMNIFNGMNDLIQYQMNIWTQQGNSTVNPGANISVPAQSIPAGSQPANGNSTSAGPSSTGSK
ncbi:hypothetical protein AQUSIP_22930 [Aquicella siphonis]|uniref:SH3b domain-containing protein n=1 Tax=Aquicella siphonis TaxID=254247 RepID=A0A5E4PL57_9COXI|nr:hypothetical protein [Aquicella siphonis]VVC76966.1 hypothetical protein AQUSIP_22930 [Aquicella siphonis]